MGQNDYTHWQLIADSDEVFTISGIKLVRFGAGNSYAYRILTGRQKWNIPAFRSDPAPYIHKKRYTCMDYNIPVDPNAASCDNWLTIAYYEGANFRISREKKSGYPVYCLGCLYGYAHC